MADADYSLVACLLLCVLVRERRTVYGHELNRRYVPRVLLSDGTESGGTQTDAAESADGTLRGTPASAGVVSGKARVILDPADAHLEPGEIHIAPSTDPGWTPLFLIASGLVMEMGGAISHGAVVAREYGIPAVVSVLGVTDPRDAQRDTGRLTISHQEEADNACSNFEAVEGEAA